DLYVTGVQTCALPIYAGIAGPTARVEDIRPEDWDRCIAVDLNGMFYCTRKAMPMIKAAGGGSIINLSSAAGRLAFPMRTPYSARSEERRVGKECRSRW